jgi:hypothetical protein
MNGIRHVAAACGTLWQFWQGTAGSKPMEIKRENLHGEDEQKRKGRRHNADKFSGNALYAAFPYKG